MADNCAKCSKSLAGEATLSALGKKYHPHCFTCTQCGKNFPDNKFSVMDDKPYCNQDCVDNAGPKVSCGGCGQAIVGGVTLSALDKKWHEACFKCATCKSAFPGGKFSVMDGRPFCNQACVDAAGPAVSCGKCNRNILGGSLSALGKKYHSDCFVCDHCGKAFPDNKFFVHENKPFCNQGCIDSSRPAGAPRAAGDGASAGGASSGGGGSAESRVVAASENIPCTLCHERLDGESIIALDRQLHPKCFQCSHCHKPFPTLVFSHHENKLFCDNECLDNSRPPIMCKGCKNRIKWNEESFVALDGEWHGACFKCGSCQKPLRDYVDNGKQAFCGDECMAKAK